MDEMNWTQPVPVQTRYGAKQLQKATPTESFWQEWRYNKAQLKKDGYSLTKNEYGQWEVLYWGDPEDKEEILEASASKGSNFYVPAPDGLSYFPYQRAGVEFITQRDNTLLADAMGVGKGLVLGTKVYTPTGLTEIETISVGDKVIGSNGKATVVTGVYPQPVQDVFRVTFNDGFSVDVDESHLWYVESPHVKRNKSSNGHVLSTKQLLDTEGFVERKGMGHNKNKTYKVSTYYKKKNGNNSWCIPIVEPIQFENQPVSVEPYLMGLILGDGSIDIKGRISLFAHQNDAKDILGDNYKIDSRGLAYKYLNNYKEQLKQMKLNGSRSWNKHIPNEYKYNSVEVRLAVLQGLMDTDGTPSGHSTEYSTTSKQLCDDVVEIVQSLGGIARVRQRTPKYTYKGMRKKGRLSYRVNIKLPSNMNPFRLERKAKKYIVPTKYQPNRYIVNIQKLPEQQKTICISVDAEDKLYVAEHAIVTHNTIQVIGAINWWNQNNHLMKKVLIVCPNSLKYNWKNELEKWLTKDYNIGVVERKDFPEEYDILIINYDVVSKHEEKLKSHKWDLFVADESHYVKNSKAKRTKSLLGKGKSKGIEAHKSVFMTGTPITNKPSDLFSALHYLDPERWRSWWKFVFTYEGAYEGPFGLEFSGPQNLEQLQDTLRSTIMIRRLKEDVLKDLPEKSRKIIPLHADSATRKLINEEHEALYIKSLADNIDLSESVDDESLGRLAQLRKEIAFKKLPTVKELINDVLDNGEKVIVFAHHKDIVKELYKEYEDSAVYVTGDVKSEARQEAVDKFQNDDSIRVFIGNIKAAGVGITLTASSNVVFAEISWVPSDLTQAEDRSLRIGQKNNVLVQYPLYEDSVDMNMIRAVMSKQNASDRALDLEYNLEDYVVRPEKIAPSKKKASKTYTDEEKAGLHKKLRVLASYDTDRAQTSNGLGFSKTDTNIGHSLAESLFLSDRQAEIAEGLVKKYRRQLGED